jgi:predicted anti-sigma-YlaC factor YlaD
VGAVLPEECERARAWASLELDGELSEVEQALMRAHVGRCVECAAFVSDLTALTRELRASDAGSSVGSLTHFSQRPSR